MNQNSFEILLDLSFFIPELLKWIGMQEIGRLKTTCKKIQSKLTIQTIRPILEENLTFRSLIFRNRLEIIEQIIPFKYNNRKHKFPRPVLINLFNKAAKEGNMNLINLLISEECRSVFGFVDFPKFLEIAMYNGHIEIAKLLFSKLESLMEISTQYGSHQATSWKTSLLHQSFNIAYSRNDREFIKWLLKESNSTERLELLEEIEKVTFELKSNNQSEDDIKKQQQWLESLYYVSTLFGSPPNPYNFLKSLMNDGWKKDSGTFERLKKMTGPILKILPEKAIADFCEHWSARDKIDDHSYFIWLDWSIFFDDFEKFKEIANKLNLKGTTNWPLNCLLPDSPLYAVIVRTMERNLPIKYFNFCLDSCNPQEMNPRFTAELRQCLRMPILFKRLDIVEKLLHRFPMSLLKEDPSFTVFLLEGALSTEDPNVLKWILKELDLKQDSEFINLTIGSVDSLKILFDSGIRLTCLPYDSINQCLLWDLDICKMMFRHKSWTKEFDSISNWVDLIDFSLEHGDEQLLIFLFSLRSEFPNNHLSSQLFLTRFELMKQDSIIPNLDVITELMKTFKSN